MEVAIYGRILNEANTPYVQTFFDLLFEKGWNISIYYKYFNSIRSIVRLAGEVNTFETHQEIKKKVDYLFSIGGDGTLLNVLPLVRDSEVPVIGINTGRLGFLSSIGKENIENALEEIEKGNYRVDRKSLIHLDSNVSLFNGVNYALNEFTIHKKHVSSMVTVHTYVDGVFLNSYWADGLLVATPTGSTAYSLSCGGPIIFPNSGNFVITPVAPHNLNARPVVVSDESVISFKVEGRGDRFLCTLDSRVETIDSSVELSIRKEDFYINLVRLENDDFMTTLRSKLMWGADKRN